MILWQLLVIALLLLLNGFFAMSELAIVSARRVRLKEMAKAGSRGATAALRLIDDPVKLLSTTQVGITLVGIVAGAYSGATLADPLAHYLQNIPIIGDHAKTLAFGVVIHVAVTYFSLVIGELVPKRLALNNAEAIAASVAPFMRVLASAGAPVVWFLRLSTHAVLRLLGTRPAPDNVVTEEEVKALIAEGASTGVFHPAEREMIEGVLRIGDRTVRSIMVPRPAVVWLDVEDTPEAIYATIAESGHSRYPVARGDIEEVIGSLTWTSWSSSIEAAPSILPPSPSSRLSWSTSCRCSGCSSGSRARPCIWPSSSTSAAPSRASSRRPTF